MASLPKGAEMMRRPFTKLDDVVKAMDFCINDGDAPNCLGCPYADKDGEAACTDIRTKDVLHYKKWQSAPSDQLDQAGVNALYPF